ncbi:MAG TPA: F0F1 ATP synthase subunit delta [Mycobacteriales bacterium]|jgi:F-type H+-transporting ATPase subunit delta|nr:F0F1 ATP synthase subunit delta [Mycobacteriales bacterium]
MQGASRLSLAAVTEQLDRQLSGAGDLGRTSDELFSVAGLLDREFALRRVLSDPSTQTDARTSLLESLLGQQITAGTLEILRGVVAARWSRPPDLTDSIEQLGRQTVFIEAERAGVLDEVEDELFRFGRILDREPALSNALTDAAQPAPRRIELLDSLLAGKVHSETRRLLEHVVAAPRERSLDHVIDALSDQAASYRSRSIARVRSSVPMTPDQESRLAGSLRRIYGRNVVLQTEVDRELLGGLVVHIDDDVIDGSVLSRLDAARRRLTR